jgi:hypothetical protein
MEEVYALIGGLVNLLDYPDLIVFTYKDLRLRLDVVRDPLYLGELRSPDPAGEQGLAMAWLRVVIVVFPWWKA